MSTATPMLTYFLKMISLGGHVDRGVELREHLQRRRDDLHGDRGDREVAAGRFRPASRTACAALRAPVMSARSYCVTCGIGRPRRAQVLGGLAAHGAHRLALDLAPAREVGQRLAAGGAAPRPPPPVTSRFDVRLHVVDRNAAARPGARHVVDVDAELARHPPHRRRRRRRRRFGRGRLGRRRARRG